MKFGKINHVILLGGSRCTAELSLYLKKNNVVKFNLFTSLRQIEDVIYSDGTKFGEFLKLNEIEFIISKDINTDLQFLNIITPSTLGIGLGEAWTFTQDVIYKFQGKLVDLMGIRMPQYRGGAHYSWQILRGNRIGACNIQLVNKDMVQGVFDSGEIIKFKEYLFPPKVRIPEDYFNHAVEEEIRFVVEFLQEILENREFLKMNVQENFSIYFPRLNTIKNAFIDWNWSSLNIEKIICAFDNPYVGATTFINEKKVRIKKARFETNDGPFHPFQFGLIYKIYMGNIYVATAQGTIIISEVLGEEGNIINTELKNGDRFYTPQKYMEEALTTKIKY